MSEHERPSIDELCELMRQQQHLMSQQQNRIEELERMMTAGDPTESSGALALVDAPKSPRGKLSRGRLLRNAAVGAAGVAGGALLADPSIASAATGTFSSATSTPTVTVTNTGTGQGLTAAASSSSAVILGSNSGTGAGLNGQTSSTGANASGMKGTLTATTPGTNAAGVRGVVGGSTASSAGVIGQHSGAGMGVYGTSATGIGVEGDSASTADFATAVHGLISSTSPGGYSAGVRGENRGTGGDGIGVYGSQNGSGWGVYGTSVSGIGVFGYSTGGYGVYAQSSSGDGLYTLSDSGSAIAAYSEATSAGATAVYASLEGSSPGSGTSAVYGTNADTSTSGSGVYGIQAGDGYGVRGDCDGSDGYGVYGSSSSGFGVVGFGAAYALYGIGNFAVTGTKAAVVELSDELRTFYCTESPECWFEDFGSASLKSGSASVSLDALFAESVETDDYYVFLSPEGNCNGLYVTNKTGDGFQVKELQGGSSSITFGYRIVALRADVDAPRLAIASNVPSQKAAAPGPKVAAPAKVSVKQ
jgi:hypothetical protein